MEKSIVYVHGQGGNAEDASYYRKFFPDCTVIGFDYAAQTVMEAEEEFPRFFGSLKEKYAEVYLIAESIGAYYAMCSLRDTDIQCAFFISPVIDMEKIIRERMRTNGISEEDLKRRKVIPLEKDTLSWEYLTYAKTHPVFWEKPAYLLFGEHDSLTEQKTMLSFACKNRITVSIMPDGEHWFHTDKQMQYLDHWLESCIRQRKTEERFDLHFVREEEYEETLTLEPRCFAENEVVAEELLRPRMEGIPEYYMIATDRKIGTIAGSICGIATNRHDFSDDFFTDLSLHEPWGKTVMILGLDVLEEYRKQGLATALMKKYLGICALRGHTRAVLTCVEEKVEMYRKMGFRDLGISASSWGNEAWHEMEIEIGFPEEV